MLDIITHTTLWLAIPGIALMAGLYFTFSVFVMQSLNELAPAAAIDAMNAINRVILRSAVMPVFFGSSLLALALVILAWLQPELDGRGLMLAAGTLYLLGMLLCTVVRNVPLNDWLAARDGGASADADWQHYYRHWTRWNHVRTVSCTLAVLLLMRALQLA